MHSPMTTSTAEESRAAGWMRIVLDTNVLVSAALTQKSMPEMAALVVERRGGLLKSLATEEQLFERAAIPRTTNFSSWPSTAMRICSSPATTICSRSIPSAIFRSSHRRRSCRGWPVSKVSQGCLVGAGNRLSQARAKKRFDIELDDSRPSRRGRYS